MSEISEVKKILRSQLRAALRELTQEERDWSDRELCQQFLSHPTLEKAQTILLYYGEASIAQNVDFITKNLPPNGKVYILGSTARVSDSSVKKIFAITADGTFPSL